MQAIKVYGGGSVAPVIPAVLTDGYIHASGRFIRSAAVPPIPTEWNNEFLRTFFFTTTGIESQHLGRISGSTALKIGQSNVEPTACRGASDFPL